MKYFAYGSNMNPCRMKKERRIDFSRQEHATLRGWKLKFNKIAFRSPEEGYANIEKDEGSNVEGVLYTIKDADTKKLDRYEGYPDHYDRRKVKVELDSGEEVKAVTYIAKPNKVEDGLKPSKSYLDHLLKGCNLLSREYCKRLKKWKTLD
ncbi:gamma-glutamylcyclotransferase [bacterium]|nr:gamma-glutamylcyclotransferase [bacterium]